MKRVTQGTWRKALVAWAMVLGSGAAGCHADLPRLAAQGRHEAVVAEAGKARLRPRGKAARAWATSLVALGRADEARAVLLYDFRTRADLASLVALADLEASEGREGIAAAHYARAASLETDTLAGRADVCGLFRRRAERFFAEGEGNAADLDLRRVAAICPKGKQGSEQDELQWRADRALHDRVIVAARAQVRAQRALAGCAKGECRAPSGEAQATALTQALAQARAAGPSALREAAGRLRVQLAAGDTAELLAAELRGELGLDVVTLDELRGWIGEASPADVVAAAESLAAPIERDYVRLRLMQLGPGYELPGGDATRSTASVVVRLFETFDADPAAAAMSWRVFALLGDLPSAELALTSSLGGPSQGRVGAVERAVAQEIAGPGAGDMAPETGAARAGRTGEAGKKGAAGRKDRAEPGGASAGGASTGGEAGAGAKGSAGDPVGGAAGPKDRSGESGAARGPGDMVAGAGSPVVPRPGLWSARGEVDAVTLPRLLLLARLRGLAGRRDQALAIASYALSEARARGLAAIPELAAAEARHELAAGRPWAAIALARVVPAGPADDVVRAAGSAIALERASCGERCGDADDRGAVRQVFGETWLQEQEGRALEAAFAREAPTRRATGCPVLAELLAPDASGELATTLRRARREGLRAEGLPDALRRAVEADLTLECAGRIAVPLMYAADARVAAEALADVLTHVPQEIGSGQLAVQSELALILGRRDQADQLAIAAAAASVEPRLAWRRAAAIAGWVDARHHELLALRQGLLHGPRPEEAEALRQRLVVRGLRDANDAWAPRNAEAGREAFTRSVESYLGDLPAARRWHAREDLAFALAEYEWADAEAAELLRAAVWPSEAIARVHPAGHLRLERALGSLDPAEAPPSLAPDEVAAWLSPRTGSGPNLETLGPDDKVSPIPRVTEALCAVDALQRARLVALRRGLAPDERRRAAIALAVTGDAATRQRALQALLAGLEPARRDATLDAIVAGLAAAEARGAVPMVAGEDELLALVFGLVRDPARKRPEIKGQ